jgi:hypothetical protein
LRKKSGQVKFVEQGFMHDLLVWWNGGLGTLKSAMFRGFFAAPNTPRRVNNDDLEHSNRPVVRMASRLTGIAGKTIQTG